MHPSYQEIRFQEAVLGECDRIGVDANNLSDEDWMACYDLLGTGTDFNFLVLSAVRAAASPGPTRK